MACTDQTTPHAARNVGSMVALFRQYSDTRVSMLRIVQNFSRRNLAQRRGNRLAREKRAVIAVQCAYRSRKARLAAAYKRVIRYLCCLGTVMRGTLKE